MQFQIKKDRVSLDIYGGILTLAFKGLNLPIKMNKACSLDIIEGKVCLSFDGQTYHLDFPSLENVFFSPPGNDKNLMSIAVSNKPIAVSSKPIAVSSKPTNVAKEDPRPNHIRYAFDPKRLHPLTSKVLSLCSGSSLSRKEIFSKLLDEKSYKQFLLLDKYRRSYDYYRPLLWTLEKEGLLYCDFGVGRHAKDHKFQTTPKGKEFLSLISK